MDSTQLVEIKERLWNGSINVRILLEVEGSDVSIEYLTSIYRNSYFPIHFPGIISYFQRFVPALGDTPIWLEYDGVPIKWNLPVGLLYDFLHLSSIIDRQGDSSWTLQLKFTDYPSEYIIPFIYKNEDNSSNYEKSLKEVIVNQLKQSCFVINGSSKPIMKLSESDSDELWNSIKLHNFKSFNLINKKIIPNKLQKIPVKFYIPGSTNMVQAPIFAYENDEPVRLIDILKKYLSDLFIDSGNVASIYIHGINTDSLLEQELNLIDIWKIFKHLDNFLYIVVMLKN